MTTSRCAKAGPMVRPRRTLLSWWRHFRCEHHWTWCHPGDGRTPWSVCTFCGWRVDDHAGALAEASRLLIPGTRTKSAEGNYFYVRGQLHGLRLACWAMREQVCERVVVGTETVTREIPDPEALAAVPTTTVTETVEKVEWRCTPLLAPAERVSA